MENDSFFTKYNISLNDQQIAAVRDVNGQTLLLAVPGSGKTTTLVCRIGYMIYALGIAPESILVLTFSTAAAADMQHRFITLFGENSASKIKFRTIHSICLGIIVRYSQIHDLRKPEVLPDNFNILFRLYQDVYGDFPNESDIRNMQLAITRAKNLRHSGEMIGKTKVGDLQLKPLYDRYQRYLETSSQIDYDDQLILAYEILSKDHSALSAMQERYRFILVDEAQDTSKVQHDIINLLAARYKQIFMVGDEDQSIYGFRAAYSEALLQFGKIYHAANVLKLERNYRSVPEIVTAADRFIRLNRNRYPKNMIPVRNDSGSLEIVRCNYRADQYSYITEHLLPGMKGRTAILYRNNDSMIPFVAELMRKKIRYRCKGMETTFFSSRTVQDLIRIMRSAFEPYNVDLFMATYSILGAKIRKAYAMQAVDRYDRRRHSSIWDSLLDLNEIGSKNREQVKTIIQTLNSIRATGNVRIAISKVCDLGYKRAGDDKAFLLKMLADKQEKIDNFLRRLSDLEYRLPQSMDNSANITLSTIHASKGLEYDNVVIIDALSPVFPGRNENLEEERRLFYVAMTRAKSNLYLMKYAAEHQPFIKDVEQRCTAEETSTVKKVPSTLNPYEYRPSRKSYNLHKAQSYDKHADPGIISGAPITHKKFGKGFIVDVAADKFTVKFDRFGEKKDFSIDFAIENPSVFGISRKL